MRGARVQISRVSKRRKALDIKVQELDTLAVKHAAVVTALQAAQEPGASENNAEMAAAAEEQGETE
jgi:transcription elongation GreA/GreB family factor